MEEKKNRKALPEAKQSISLAPHPSSRYRGFSFFLILCALFVAAFGVGAFFAQSRREMPENGLAFTQDSQNPGASGNTTPESTNPSVNDPPVPEGATPVISMDLCQKDLGMGYLHNQTPYRPDVLELLKQNTLRLDKSTEVQVLILHTHTSESYLEDGAMFVEGSIGEASYSSDAERNVLAVGKALCESLNKKGITSMQCTVMHDEPSLSGSYSRAEKTVRAYLEQYPSIVCVIDLHRDAILTEAGEYVRTYTTVEGEEVAQIMAVVGSDCNGTRNERWQENLALALQLRALCEECYPGISRPVSLRAASYNQELAPYYLLLEIGSGGNSVEEAVRAAELFAEVFCELVYSG